MGSDRVKNFTVFWWTLCIRAVYYSTCVG